MKDWNFKVKNNPTEIKKYLQSSLESVNGFALEIKSDNSSSITFKIRKRLLYAWYIAYHNNLAVNGKLTRPDDQNETTVHISFSQNVLWKFVIFAHIFLVLSFITAIILGNNSGNSMYLLAVITLAIAILLWFRLQKKHKKDIEEYKNLLSETLQF
ncbi:DUF423 domain-containing protein [Zunongwangia pacifica]|uniref:DUF423 domain-containing protein n=1 Tax=Zunongwangia pacifica TaxID=2911062 RepID=A0A9X2CNG1_9FLAO|nr:DUF423 domain-containing protein [Zunongwangia pacifica]MCL6220515.1 DUF423 domain-containing protein [Zunongwangia pacifica]